MRAFEEEPMARTDGGWLLPPWLLRGLALFAGLVGLALPAVVVRWVTATTPLPQAPEAGPLRPEMVVIPEDSYTIGGDEAAFRSLPLTEAELGAFAISATEVTRQQYKLVMGQDPSSEPCDPGCPVTDVSWCRIRVIRGGSFVGPPQIARVAYRYVDGPSDRFAVLGFRVARSLP